MRVKSKLLQGALAALIFTTLPAMARADHPLGIWPNGAYPEHQQEGRFYRTFALVEFVGPRGSRSFFHLPAHAGWVPGPYDPATMPTVGPVGEVDGPNGPIDGHYSRSTEPEGAGPWVATSADGKVVVLRLGPSVCASADAINFLFPAMDGHILEEEVYIDGFRTMELRSFQRPGSSSSPFAHVPTSEGLMALHQRHGRVDELPPETKIVSSFTCSRPSIEGDDPESGQIPAP